MRSRKLLALIFSLLAIAPALAGYMTLLGAGVGSIAPVVSWVSTTDPTFPSSSLTFSRTSLATMFDSTGKLTYAPNNLLTQSNTFSNVAWAKQFTTVASGATDRLGGTSAWTVTATSANGQLYAGISVSTAASTNFIPSLWIKRRTGTGNIKFYNPAATVATIIAVDNTWKQFYIPGLGTGTSAYITLLIETSGDAVDISEAGLSAVTYETTPRTADQVITTSSAYYGPRIDYDPNTLAVKGLLIEEARTNYAFPSQALAGWSPTGVAVSDNSVASPSGATNASTITGIAGASQHNIQTLFTIPAGVNTGSYFVKYGNHRWIAVAIFDGGWKLQTFDMLNGVKGSTTTAGVIATMTPLANGWYRASVTYTTTGASAYLGFFLLGGDNSTLSWAAAGTEIAYAFGAQFEPGSFATSYIPTAAASVTRAADVVQFTGAALTALQGSAWSAAVQFADVASYAGNPSIFDTSSNLQTVFMNGNKAAFFPTSLNTANGLSVLASHRIAASATRSGGRSIVSDGGTVATDATAMTSPPNTYLGSNVGAGNFLNGHVASFAIYNQRLPDATLQAKSVVGASYAANDNGLRFADNDNLPIHWRVAL